MISLLQQALLNSTLLKSILRGKILIMERNNRLSVVDVPENDPKVLEFKSPEEIEDERIIRRFKSGLYQAWIYTLSSLEIDEADVMWKILSFEEEEEIAEGLQTSTREIENIRESAMLKLGGENKFF